MKYILKNGRVIDPATCTDTTLDIIIDGRTIAAIGKNLPESGTDMVFDLTGLVVTPGLVDIHVHFRDPGFEYKEDVESGSRAAIKGGFTSVACMPNTNPVCDNPEILRYITNKAESVGGCRVYPIAAITVSQKGEIIPDYEKLKSAGAVALSDDGHPVENAAVMRKAIIKAADTGLMVISHCEDLSLAVGGVMNQGAESERLGFTGIPRESEEIMIAREAVLAAATDKPVHIAHVSTRGSVEIIRAAKARGVKITCETCPHYMLLTDTEIAIRGSAAKMNPPLRTEDDRTAIIAGLKDGTIDAIVTDHAPHAVHEKGEVQVAANGVTGLETSLSATLTALHGTGMALIDIIAAMTIRPAAILGLNAGKICIGGLADITVFDPEREWIVNSANLVSKGKNTPFDGMKLTGKTEYVFVGGKMLLKQGELLI